MENNTAVLIAIVSAIATLTGGGYAAWVQLKRDKAAGNVELIRLQDEIETKLWQRYSADFDKLSARVDRQDVIIREQATTIQEQGALLMQHRDRIRELENDRDQWKERAELAERNNTGGKGRTNL